MNRIFRYAFWKLKRIKVFALVGDSGTGKSFQSKMIADKYKIDLIIDDGLLIKDDTILAGRSAKQEANFLTAVKTALFDDDQHQMEVYSALQKEKYNKILILGTSEKMVFKIASRLKLLPPEKIIKIEDFATKEEIEIAKRIRFQEGKHIIPVPPLEITRNYPKIVYDNLRVFLNKNKFWLPKKSYEKTVVRPSFSKIKSAELTEAAITQMVSHCLHSFDNHIRVLKVQSSKSPEDNYNLHIFLNIPTYHTFPLNKSTSDLEEYVKKSLYDYASLCVDNASLEISEGF